LALSSILLEEDLYVTRQSSVTGILFEQFNKDQD